VQASKYVVPQLVSQLGIDARHSMTGKPSALVAIVRSSLRFFIDRLRRGWLLLRTGGVLGRLAGPHSAVLPPQHAPQPAWRSMRQRRSILASAELPGGASGAQGPPLWQQPVGSGVGGGGLSMTGTAAGSTWVEAAAAAAAFHLDVEDRVAVRTLPPAHHAVIQALGPCCRTAWWACMSVQCLAAVQMLWFRTAAWSRSLPGTCR